MLKSLVPALAAACLLAASPALLAQPSAPGDGPKGPRGARVDCSKAQDPKACEERVAQRRETMQKARAACEGRQGDDYGACMRTQVCAQSADPAKCEAGAKERVARRAQMREACKDKTGDALRACIREQRGRK
jgi:Spy/CpxP family protein refolding chaperone